MYYNEKVMSYKVLFKGSEILEEMNKRKQRVLKDRMEKLFQDKDVFYKKSYRWDMR